MLHILLLILKIVGIILAVILGIIILLLGIVLFVPIRYEISAKCDGTIESLKAKVKATWLLHLLRADILVKGKKLKWQVKAAWIKKTSAMEFGGRKEEISDEAKEEKSDKESQTVEEENCKDEVVKETAEVCEEKCKDTSETVEENRCEENQKDSGEAAESTSEKREANDQEGEKDKGSNELLDGNRRIDLFHAFLSPLPKIPKGLKIRTSMSIRLMAMGESSELR